LKNIFRESIEEQFKKGEGKYKKPKVLSCKVQFHMMKSMTECFITFNRCL